MSFISKSVTGRQFLLNMSFTYFGLIYYIIKLQNCSSLDGRVIANKISKCLLSLKVLQSNIKVPLVYLWVDFNGMNMRRRNFGVCVNKNIKKIVRKR